MDEDTPVQRYLNEFNSVKMNMENIEIKIESEALIVLGLSPSLYETLVDTLLYGKYMISL